MSTLLVILIILAAALLRAIARNERGNTYDAW